jgi:hypothetical protein
MRPSSNRHRAVAKFAQSARRRHCHRNRGPGMDSIEQRIVGRDAKAGTLGSAADHAVAA